MVKFDEEPRPYPDGPCNHVGELRILLPGGSRILPNGDREEITHVLCAKCYKSLDPIIKITPKEK